MRALCMAALLLIIVAGCGDSEPVAAGSSGHVVTASPDHCPPGHERRGLCTPEPEPDPEPEPPEEPDPDPPEEDGPDPEEPEPEPPPTIATSPQLTWGAPYPVAGPYPLVMTWDEVEGVDGYRVTYGPQGGEFDVTAPPHLIEVAVEVGWLCVRTVRGDALSGQRCNGYPSEEPHNKMEILNPDLTIGVDEEGGFVAVRWWDARMTVPVVLPSGDRGWIEVELITDGEAHALRTVPGGIWRPDPEAIIHLEAEEPEIASVNDILYTLTADPSLGFVIVVEWGETTEPAGGAEAT